MQTFIAKARLYISHGSNKNFTIRLYDYIYLMGLVDCMRSQSFILILVMGHVIDHSEPSLVDAKSGGLVRGVQSYRCLVYGRGGSSIHRASAV